MADNETVRRLFHEDGAVDIVQLGGAVFLRFGSRTIQIQNLTQADRYVPKGRESGTAIRHRGEDGKEYWHTSEVPYDDFIEMLANAGKVIETNAPETDE